MSVRAHPFREPPGEFYLRSIAALTAVGLLMFAPCNADPHHIVIANQQERVVDFLRRFEVLQEKIHPERIRELQEGLKSATGTLFDDLEGELAATDTAPGGETWVHTWSEAVGLLRSSYEIYVQAEPHDFFPAFLDSRTTFSRARYLLYELRPHTPGLRAYWVLPEMLAELPSPAASTAGSVATGFSHHPRASSRGAYSLYVPERYTPERGWPLVIALHGGHGTGKDYLWTWVRAAKSHDYVVLAPSSLGATWSFDQPDLDLRSILSILDVIVEAYAIDAARILVTGLSDGGTFAYVLGATMPGRFAAIAPIAGVLPPWLDLGRSKSLPILIVHGTDDYIFPVTRARRVHTFLQQHEFDVTYRELADWGHAYTYSINEAVVLPWFEAN